MSRGINPFKHLPKVGIPAEVPSCQTCFTPLKPQLWLTYPKDAEGRSDHQAGPVAREFSRWQGYPLSNPLFCTRMCATRFAVAAHKLGLRMQPKPKKETA